MSALKSHHPARGRASGFTLVELLVVIAIIALLIGILMPSMQKAKESARSVACLSNLRQLGIVTANYAAENKGYLFPCWYDGNVVAGATTSSMPNILIRYVPKPPGVDRSMWTCPSAITGTTNQFIMTYGANMSVHIRWDYTAANVPRRPLRRASKIRRPSEVFTLADATQNSGAWTSTGYLEFTSDDVLDGVSELRPPGGGSAANQKKPADTISGWSVQTDVSSNYHVRYRHNAKQINPKYTDGVSTVNYTGSVGWANFLFMDGHAAPVRYGELKCRNIATWY